MFAQGPTSNSIDAAICPHLFENAIGHFRTRAIEGKTSTLRANAVSMLGFLPGRENAEVVARALDTDPKDSESRWVAGWLLQRLAPVLG